MKSPLSSETPKGIIPYVVSVLMAAAISAQQAAAMSALHKYLCLTGLLPERKIVTSSVVNSLFGPRLCSLQSLSIYYGCALHCMSV